ncbi:hypothetical protein [Hyphomicrobium sp.]|uniref:hypothetical protein n=1 Tax=Hyphomicrobium sp. TaxID=82 RepID=UPI002E362DD5|nr:hypothetical protein [Hyphomicrobium sp.]HEX2843482.1 hypothetical protein [Hyphomicrobium sp.]
MRTRKASLTFSAAALALGLAAAHQAWAEPSTTMQGMTVAQSEDSIISNPPQPDPQTLTNPSANKPVTPAEVAECMKSWDPQSGMSKEEYKKSCESSLRYFPEKGD